MYSLTFNIPTPHIQHIWNTPTLTYNTPTRKNFQILTVFPIRINLSQPYL